MEEQIEGEWVVVALSNRHVQQVCMHVTIPTSSGNFRKLFTFPVAYAPTVEHSVTRLWLHIPSRY